MENIFENRQSSKGLFNYPTDHEGLTALKYDPELL